jgi:hypothetical protein
MTNHPFLRVRRHSWYQSMRNYEALQSHRARCPYESIYSGRSSYYNVVTALNYLPRQ